MKTIKLTGLALERAKEHDKLLDETNAMLNSLDKQKEAVIEAANKKLEGIWASIKEAAGIDKESPCQMDSTYLKHHGDAYVRIQPPQNPLIEMMMGGAQEDKRTLQ